MSIFEAIMLLCFGVSWPFSIAKSLRTKTVRGKCPVFMTIVCVGYMSGVIHKIIYSLDWITALYAVNMILVAFDLYLYIHYSKRETIEAIAVGSSSASQLSLDRASTNDTSPAHGCQPK
ncbi:MAG: hypothetical protein JXN60_05250 [Lentisphaerae bacterium]|nr:hypothetical protein [Lentisphaerota bacterium]